MSNSCTFGGGRLMVVLAMVFTVAGCKACEQSIMSGKRNDPSGKSEKLSGKMILSESGNIGLIEYSPQYPPPKMKAGRFYAIYNEKKQQPMNPVFYYLVKEHPFNDEKAFLDSVAAFDYNSIMTYRGEHFGYGSWKGAIRQGSNKIKTEAPVILNGKEFNILTVSAQYDYRENAENKSQPAIYTRTFQVAYHVGAGYIFEMVMAGNRIVMPNGVGEGTIIDLRSINAYLGTYVRLLR